MIETFRHVRPTPSALPFIFRIQSGTAERVGRVAVLRGGTWNDRPIVNGRGVVVNDRLYPLAEIMNSPEAADPHVR